jgi:Zinc knuckle
MNAIKPTKIMTDTPIFASRNFISGSNNHTQNMTQQNDRSRINSNKNNRDVCYRCNQQGHIARNCPISTPANNNMNRTNAYTSQNKSQAQAIRNNDRYVI